MATTARTRRRTAARAAELELRLDAGIYTRKVIQRAMQAYASHARFVLSRDGSDHLVRFTDVAGESAQLVDEFANFVLGCLAEE